MHEVQKAGTDFVAATNGVDLTIIQDAVWADVLVTTTFHGCRSENDYGDVYFVFDSVPAAGELTQLDVLIAAHTGVQPAIPEVNAGSYEQSRAQYKSQGTLSLSGSDIVAFPARAYPAAAHPVILPGAGDTEFTLDKIGLWQVIYTPNLQKNWVTLGANTSFQGQVEIYDGSMWKASVPSIKSVYLWNSAGPDKVSFVCRSEIINVDALATYKVRAVQDVSGGSDRTLTRDSTLEIVYLGTS